MVQVATAYVTRLSLCRKLHLFLGKSTTTVVTRAALFDLNMHIIVYQLGPGERPQLINWAAYCSPQPSYLYLRAYFYREGRE